MAVAQKVLLLALRGQPVKGTVAVPLVAVELVLVAVVVVPVLSEQTQRLTLVALAVRVFLLLLLARLLVVVVVVLVLQRLVEALLVVAGRKIILAPQILAGVAVRGVLLAQPTAVPVLLLSNTLQLGRLLSVRV